MFMTISTIKLVFDSICMEVQYGQHRKTCSSGKGSGRYSKENPQLPADTKERKD
jgi:hypothetical protein